MCDNTYDCEDLSDESAPQCLTDKPDADDENAEIAESVPTARDTECEFHY